MKIALLSPKGPLYRSRGGIFKKSLRYQPLTLTTLAALAPPELDVEFALYDEGIEDIPLDLAADLVGMTVITGSSAARLRAGRSLSRARHHGGAGRSARHAGAGGGAAARRRHLRRLCGRNLAAAAARFRRRRHAAALRPGPRLQAHRTCRSRAASCSTDGTSSPRPCSRRRAPARTTASSASCRPPGAASSFRSRSGMSSRTSAGSASAASSSSISI